jgi:chorismate mutase/prephenate dehydratase
MENKLKECRKALDSIDEQLIKLIAQRQTIGIEVANYKLENNLEPFQPKREKEVLKTRINQGKNIGLSEKFIIDFFQLIMDESKILQNQIIKNAKP